MTHKQSAINRRKAGDSWSDQYRSPNWQRKRLEALEDADFACQNCGDGDSQLQVHHKRYVKGRAIWDYKVSELSVLCDECHKRAHAIKDLTQELIARTYCWADSEILAVLAGYVGSAEGPARADVSDILPLIDEPSAERAGRLAALAQKRLDADNIRTLYKFLETANPGESITLQIPVSKTERFGEFD